MKHWLCFLPNYHRQRIIDFGELQLFDRYADDFVIKKIIYMHPLIQALRSELVAIIARIDSGDCDIYDIDDMDEVVSVIRKVSHRDKPLSKYAACEYLHISRATFDNYVQQGLIPQGVHEQGFKELSWYKKDLDLYREKYGKKKRK